MLRPMQITAGQLERHPERWLDDMLDAGYTARTPEGAPEAMPSAGLR